MPYVNPADYLVSAEQGSGAGMAMDCRNALGRAYYHIATYAASAVYTLQASYDATAWMVVATYTATPTTATGQISDYYPYVRAQVNNLYSGGGNTGSGIFFFHPLR